MSALTGSELIAQVKGNLGNRDSGTVGGVAIDTAAMNSINAAIIEVTNNNKLSIFERTLEIPVADAGYKVTVPTVDSGNNPITILDWLRLSVYKTGETTGYNLKRLTIWERDRLFPLTTTDNTGRPQYYTFFQDCIEFWPIADDDYIVIARIVINPTKFTSTSLGVSHNLGEPFDNTLVSFATHDCFLKLQQTTDAASWFQRYRHDLAGALKNVRSDTDLEVGRIQSGRVSADPVNDPFVSSFNS